MTLQGTGFLPFLKHRLNILLSHGLFFSVDWACAVLSTEKKILCPEMRVVYPAIPRCSEDRPISKATDVTMNFFKLLCMYLFLSDCWNSLLYDYASNFWTTPGSKHTDQWHQILGSLQLKQTGLKWIPDTPSNVHKPTPPNRGKSTIHWRRQTFSWPFNCMD